MESMSSADLQHYNNSLKVQPTCQGNRLKRTIGESFCGTASSSCSAAEEEEDDKESDKHLDALDKGLERLKHEKGDLLKQNVTCKTDIKKLKQRYIFFI